MRPRSGTKFAEIRGPTRSRSGKVWPTPGQHCPKLAELGPMFIDPGPNLVVAGQRPIETVQFEANIGRGWLTFRKALASGKHVRFPDDTSRHVEVAGLGPGEIKPTFVQVRPPQGARNWARGAWLIAISSQGCGRTPVGPAWRHSRASSLVVFGVFCGTLVF